MPTSYKELMKEAERVGKRALESMGLIDRVEVLTRDALKTARAEERAHVQKALKAAQDAKLVATDAERVAGHIQTTLRNAETARLAGDVAGVMRRIRKVEVMADDVVQDIRGKWGAKVDLEMVLGDMESAKVAELTLADITQTTRDAQAQLELVATGLDGIAKEIHGGRVPHVGEWVAVNVHGLTREDRVTHQLLPVGFGRKAQVIGASGDVTSAIRVRYETPIRFEGGRTQGTDDLLPGEWRPIQLEIPEMRPTAPRPVLPPSAPAPAPLAEKVSVPAPARRPAVPRVQTPAPTPAGEFQVGEVVEETRTGVNVRILDQTQHPKRPPEEIWVDVFGQRMNVERQYLRRLQAPTQAPTPPAAAPRAVPTGEPGKYRVGVPREVPLRVAPQPSPIPTPTRLEPGMPTTAPTPRPKVGPPAPVKAPRTMGPIERTARQGGPSPQIPAGTMFTPEGKLLPTPAPTVAAPEASWPVGTVVTDPFGYPGVVAGPGAAGEVRVIWEGKGEPVAVKMSEIQRAEKVAPVVAPVEVPPAVVPEVPSSAAPELSKGHVTWLSSGSELYRDARGEWFLAPRSSVLDVNTGYRIGRFLAPAHFTEGQVSTLVGEEIGGVSAQTAATVAAIEALPKPPLTGKAAEAARFAEVVNSTPMAPENRQALIDLFAVDEAKAAELLARAGQIARGAEEARAALAAPGKIGGVAGNVTTATGADVTKEYSFRYRVVELDDVVASHTVPSATAPPIPNPRYPAKIQPRERERMASGLQVERIARDLAPDELLRDRGTLDRGPSIVGPDSIVESGNGRMMALNIARDRYPERWAAYQARLRELAPQYGIPAESLEGMRAPVLVRERITPVADRADFARLANESPVLQSAPYESAVSDASRISDEAIGGLIVSESATLDQALAQVQNREFVRGILEGVPANERAALMDPSGDLNTLGLARVRAALFAKVYPGDAGTRLGRSFFESLDPDLKNVERAILDSLPAMARAESLIRAGARAPELSLTEDLSRAVDVLTRLSQQGIKLAEYLGQVQLFGRELTPVQEAILVRLDAMKRSSKQIRAWLEGYADAIMRADNPAQSMMFGAKSTTKEQALEHAATIARGEQPGQGSLFGPAPGSSGPPAPSQAPGYGRQPAGRAPQAPRGVSLAGPGAGMR